MLPVHLPPNTHTPSAGTLYKAFLVTSSTTAKQLIRQALDKANMVEDPHNYCIWQAAVIPNGTHYTFHTKKKKKKKNFTHAT